MELHQLRAFVAVAEYDGITNAAVRLHICQPAVTRKIKKLESNIGAQLFRRGNNRMRLTPAGESFLENARMIIELCDCFLEQARKLNGQQ